MNHHQIAAETAPGTTVAAVTARYLPGELSVDSRYLHRFPKPVALAGCRKAEMDRRRRLAKRQAGCAWAIS